jgi:putative glutamine amidotransferase
MSRPRIVVAPHVRELDTVLGRLRASVVYDRYLDRIVAAGGEPLTAWIGSADTQGVATLADGILLVGGGDVEPASFGVESEGEAVDVQRDGFETALVAAARASGTPLLGLCRGCQVLNVALGGTLETLKEHRQREDLSVPTHEVDVVPGTALASIVGAAHLRVNSFHRWSPGALGEGLAVAALATSGHVEAVESPNGWWALGIQWHAELLDDPASQRVFDALVASAAEARS